MSVFVGLKISAVTVNLWHCSSIVAREKREAVGVV